MREKYTTRSIILLGDPQKEIACAAIHNAPTGLEVVIREPVKVRGLDQNGLYWLRLGELAEQAWFGGRQYGKEVWHHYCGIHVMPETIVTKDGETRSKWEEVPDGDAVVISTTKLERRCFAEYTTAVEAFGASLGVQFSANPNEGRR
jgi:hypothetical protein